MPRSRQRGHLFMVAAARCVAPAAPAVPPAHRPPPDAAVAEPELSPCSLLDDLAPDPAAAAKSRLGRVSRLLWWTHRRLEYEAAVARRGEDAPGLPPRVTNDDVARVCGLAPAQRTPVERAAPGDPEPRILRLVGDAVDAG